MKFIIKLFPEIMIKSDSVRKRFIKILTSNIRNVLLRETENVAVIRNWDFIEVRAKVVEEAPMVLDLLKRRTLCWRRLKSAYRNGKREAHET